MKKSKSKPQDFCPGPTRQPYFSPEVDWSNPRSKDPTWVNQFINPQWASAGKDFCPHGRQYSHPITEQDK